MLFVVSKPPTSTSIVLTKISRCLEECGFSVTSQEGSGNECLAQCFRRNNIFEIKCEYQGNRVKFHVDGNIGGELYSFFPSGDISEGLRNCRNLSQFLFNHGSTELREFMNKVAGKLIRK